MAVREGSWWSRAWGVVAVMAFAVHLGAAVYEAVVIAPTWSLDPPKSVIAWVALAARPDSSTLFHPLTAVIVVASVMAWLSGIATRGWRRWWLTLMLIAAGALAAITVVVMLPCERELLRAAALGDDDSARIIAQTGDWMRAAASRLGALLVGAWAGYRAQLAGMLAEQPSGAMGEEFSGDLPAAPAGRSREFLFGDEEQPEIVLGDEALNPRERWRRSLRGRRRTAKK